MPDRYTAGWEDAIRAVRKEVQNLDLLTMIRTQPGVSVAQRNTHERPLPIHVVALDQVWLALEVVAPPRQQEAVCNRCGADKGKHAIGENCNTNCGGRVIPAETPGSD